MDDVIEACKDGGFDIPATSVTQAPSRPANRSSKIADRVEVKPRRIRIQLEDDGDDDDDDDGDNGDVRSTLSQTPTATAEETPGGKKEDPRNTGCSGDDVAGQIGEKSDTAHALSRPGYKIYKIETPGEDPLLEIVVSLSRENSTEGVTPSISTSAAATDERSTASSALPTPEAEGYLHENPFVSISSDGTTFVVDPNPAANGGGDERGGDGGELRGKCSLQLPQRVVPRTARSFFQGGTLTVRAVVAAG